MHQDVLPYMDSHMGATLNETLNGLCLLGVKDKEKKEDSLEEVFFAFILKQLAVVSFPNHVPACRKRLNHGNDHIKIHRL
jgi:hypothetical protein